MLKTNWMRSVFLTIVALTLVGGVAAAGELGRCYTATLPSGVVLPDGSTHAPGSLKICLSREYSPVTGLHATYVDGRPIGLFQARARGAEAPADSEDPFFLFLRNANGELVLQGYAVPDGERLCAFNMAPDGNEWNLFKVKSRWELLASNRTAGDESMVLLYAN